jgi:hypothetical protein
MGGDRFGGLTESGDNEQDPEDHSNDMFGAARPGD